MELDSGPMVNPHQVEDVLQRANTKIDLKAVLAMTGGDVNLLREMAEAYLQEVPQLLGSLRSAVKEQDSELLANASHRLQGVLRCLHMDRALQQARQIELLADSGANWTAINELRIELNAATNSAADVLTKFLGVSHRRPP